MKYIPWRFISRYLKKFLPVAFVMMILMASLWVKKPKHHPVQHRKSGVRSIGTTDMIPEPQEESSKKWLIILENRTSITDTCTEATALLPDWNIVILHKMPKPKYRHSKCMFVHVAPLDGHLNGGWTKSFFAAVENEAEIIAVSTDTSLVKEMQFLQVEKVSASLVLKTNCTRLPLSNSCGGPDLHKFKSSRTDPQLSFCEGKTPAIQGLFSSVLSSPQKGRPPSVAIDKGTFVSISNHMVLYHKQAFWAFLFSIPSSGNFKTVIIYAMQKLLWLINEKMFVKESNLVPEVGTVERSMDRFLLKWQCPASTFYECYVILFEKLHTENFISKDILMVMKEWGSILLLKQYQFPTIENDKADTHSCMNIMKSEVNIPLPSFAINDLTKHPTELEDNNVYSSIKTLLLKTCRGQADRIDLVNPWVIYEDIMLLVIFNRAHYEVLPYLKLLYGHFFPLTLYCVPSLPEYYKNYDLSFISYGATPKGHLPGAFNYRCLNIAIQLKYNVSGYMVIGDDVLLNIHRIGSNPRQNVWFLPKQEIRIGDLQSGRECRLGMCDSFAHWRWWEDYRSQLLSAMGHMWELATEDKVFYQCVTQLIQRNGGQKRANGGFADIYYLPSKLGEKFSQIAKIFLKEEVFLELAVPTILACLDDNIQPLPGVQDQQDSRNTPWVHFPKFRTLTYIHPAKLGPVAAGSKKHINFFCEQVLPYLNDKYKMYHL